MSTIQITSDLYIDGYDKPDWTQGLTPTADVLVISGNVGRVQNFSTYRDFMTSLCSGFKSVYLIPGILEFYSSTETLDFILTQLRTLENSIPNLRVLYNEKVNLSDTVQLYGATLWSYIPENCRTKILPILTGTELQANATWLNMMHFQAVFELEFALSEARASGKKVIVATACAPTLQGAPDTTTKHYVASNLERLLVKDTVHTWIYGSTSINADFTTFGGTHVVSNQMKGNNYSRRRTVKL